MGRNSKEWMKANQAKLYAYTVRSQQKKRAFVREQKECILCGEADVKKLIFSHRNPATKLFTLGQCVAHSWLDIHAELAKCEILCRHCHRTKETY
jgi:5-methylcytosine-specific restriction endonuclease McrA